MQESRACSDFNACEVKRDKVCPYTRILEVYVPILCILLMLCHTLISLNVNVSDTSAQHWVSIYLNGGMSCGNRSLIPE